MSWAVGDDPNRQRHIGYGVPSCCDQPGCSVEIDRGMAYACAGGDYGPTPDLGCGLFFCTDHRSHYIDTGDPDEFAESGCERCATGAEPFEPSPDVREWVEWVLTDESWAQFRAEYAGWTNVFRARLAELDGERSTVES